MLKEIFDSVRRFVVIVDSRTAYVKVKFGDSIPFLLDIGYPDAKSTLGILAKKNRTLFVRL
jgi:hypothetical protein